MTKGPATIGRYQVRDRLGQGGMGVLYLALDPAIDRLVALKLLRVHSDELRERFLREARLAARLQHPNIVTIYDVGEHDEQPFIAMEYIAGETLAELTQRRAVLPVTRKLGFILDACRGLAYAHKHGIVHRDIKPANLMVGRDTGVLKVLDFGIARGGDSTLTQIGMLMGTPNYMSPEQIEGRPVDRRSDIFALGLVLYELLVYRQAFKSDTPHAVLHQVLHGTPTALRTIDPALDLALVSVVDRAIEKDVDRRYQDLDALRGDLARIVKRLEAESDVPTGSARVVRAREEPVGPDGQETSLGGESPVPGRAGDEGRGAAGRAGSDGADQERAGAERPAHSRTPWREGDRARLAERRASQIAGHLAAGDTALAAGDMEAALAAAESAALLDADNAQIAHLMDRVRAAIDAREIAEWLNKARLHLEAGALTDASLAVAEALRVDQRHAGARALRTEIERAADARDRQRERDRLVEHVLQQLDESLEAGALEAALRAAGEALGYDPSSAAALAARQRVVAAIEGRVIHAIAATRADIAAGRLTGAADRLRHFTPKHERIDRELADVERRIAAAEAAAAEAARKRAEEEARRQAEEDARRLAEAEAEAARQRAEAEARRKAEEEAERERQAEARRKAEAERLAAEAEARRLAEEKAARERAEAEAARKRAEQEKERARLAAAAAAAAEAKRLAAEAEARRKAEEKAERERLAEAQRRAEAERIAAEAEAEAKRKADEEAARLRAEEEAAREREAEAARKAEAQRLAAEAEARRKAEAEAARKAEAQRIAAETEARRKAEEKAERERLAEARRRAEAERLAAEAEARRNAEEEAARKAEAQRIAAEAEAKRQAEEKAERERLAEAQRRAEAERLAAEAEARRTAEKEAARKAEAQRIAAEAEARRQAEEKAERERQAAAAVAKRLADDAAARREAEEAEARRRAEAEAARKRAEEQAERERLAEVQREAEAQRVADEVEAKRRADEAAARKRAEAEAARKRAVEEAERQRQAAAAEARRRAEETEAKRKAEAEAARKRKEEEAERKRQAAAADAAKRKAAADEARRKTEDDAKRRAAATAAAASAAAGGPSEAEFESEAEPRAKADAEAEAIRKASEATATSEVSKAAAASEAREAGEEAARQERVAARAADEDTADANETRVHTLPANVAADARRALAQASERQAVRVSGGTLSDARAASGAAPLTRSTSSLALDSATESDTHASATGSSSLASRAPWLAGIAALLLLVFGLAYLVFGRRSPEPPSTGASTASQQQGAQPSATLPGNATDANPPAANPPGSSQPGAGESSPPNSATGAESAPPVAGTAPLAGVTDSAIPAAQRLDDLLTTARRHFARQQRQRALDDLSRAPADLREDPKFQSLVGELTATARRDAEAAHLTAVRASAATRATDEFQRAEAQWQQARTAAQRPATVDTVRGLVRAQELLTAAADAANRASAVAADNGANRPPSSPPPPTTSPSSTAPGGTTATATPPPSSTRPNPPLVPPVAETGSTTRPGTGAGTSPTGTTSAPSTTPGTPTSPGGTATGSSATPPGDERAAVLQALNAWAAAYATLDVGRVAGASPLSGDQTRTLKQAFDLQRAHRVTLEDCRITQTPAAATAVCGVQRAIEFKDGKKLQASAKMTFQLARRGGGWAIVSQK